MQELNATWTALKVGGLYYVSAIFACGYCAGHHA